MAELAPFWSDDFDMDLLKILPEVPELLGQLADVPLYVHGSVDPKNGRLHHPACYNGGFGFIAFFGLTATGFLPPGYVAGREVVACTALEAIRDAWCHTYTIVLEGVTVFDAAGALRAELSALLGHRRGYSRLSREVEEQHLAIVRAEVHLFAAQLRGTLHAAVQPEK
jgi:hypothetical protein